MRRGHEFERTITAKAVGRETFTRCRCGAGLRSKIQAEIEDFEAKHYENVARASASVKRTAAHSQGVLRSERDYYIERAGDPNETKANRALWQQLADELDGRIREKETPQSETLF